MGKAGMFGEVTRDGGMVAAQAGPTGMVCVSMKFLRKAGSFGVVNEK